MNSDRTNLGRTVEAEIDFFLRNKEELSNLLKGADLTPASSDRK